MPKDLFEEHGIDLLANNTSEKEEPGFFKTLGKNYSDYYGGALRGMGQAAGDLGASAINWPISGIEHLTGRQLPHVPHPHLINENPESLGESIGQTLGQFAGTIGLPGGAGAKAAQLANRGYQALRGSQQAPLIARLLAGAGGGALEGAAGNEENRLLGAELGGALGASGHAIPSAIDFAKSISSKNIAKDIVNRMNKQKERFAHEFDTVLHQGEYAGANKFMFPERGNLAVLKKAGESKNIYALEKYNADPTLRNAHNAQSDLNRIVRKYSHSPEGTLERDAYNNALRLRNKMLLKISESIKKTDMAHAADDYARIRGEYAERMAPYLNSPTISKFIKPNPSIRPGKFADKLLEEENFMARAGQHHPGLIRRERYNALKKNKLAQGATLGATALATPFLPYSIAKILGLK